MQVLVGAQCAFCRRSRMPSELLGEVGGWFCAPFPNGLPAQYEQGLERCPQRDPVEDDRWTGPVNKSLSRPSGQIAGIASMWADAAMVAMTAIAKTKGWAPGPNAQWRRTDEEPESTAKKCKEVPVEEFMGFRERSKRPEFLSDYDAKWYKEHEAKTYKLPGVDAGYALFPDPQNGGKMTLISLHNNSGISGLGEALVEDAMANGAEALDCYRGFLSKLYSGLGFVEVRKEPWKDEYAPSGWEYTVYGRPDVVFMERRT
ncbi:MAG: hypothetical protein JW990_10985 [Thermoleophilia bacterium]|nr:hypothetical protein [Thermoleophilia bacterium]